MKSKFLLDQSDWCAQVTDKRGVQYVYERWQQLLEREYSAANAGATATATDTHADTDTEEASASASPSDRSNGARSALSRPLSSAVQCGYSTVQYSTLQYTDSNVSQDPN